MTTFRKTTAALLALAIMAPAIVSAQTAATTAPKAKSLFHYDCTKAGNKNKAACKTTTAAPVAAAPAATKPVVAKPASPGFFHRAAAPAAAAPARTYAANGNTVAYTTKTGKVIHYDCSKAGNKNKTACKGR